MFFGILFRFVALDRNFRNPNNIRLQALVSGTYIITQQNLTNIARVVRHYKSSTNDTRSDLKQYNTPQPFNQRENQPMYCLLPGFIFKLHKSPLIQEILVNVENKLRQ